MAKVRRIKRDEYAETQITKLCETSQKKKYHNRKTALTAANYEATFKRVKLYIYKCTSCRHYHLTKHPQKGETL